MAFTAKYFFFPENGMPLTPPPGPNGEDTPSILLTVLDWWGNSTPFPPSILGYGLEFILVYNQPTAVLLQLPAAYKFLGDVSEGRRGESC